MSAAAGFLDELRAGLGDESFSDALKVLIDAVGRFDFQAALEPLGELESLVDQRQ